jgi:hypothetical protein
LGDAPGNVHVFEWDDMDWKQVGSDLDGMGDGCGSSVALSRPMGTDDGTIVAIIAPRNSVIDRNAGSVQVVLGSLAIPSWALLNMMKLALPYCFQVTACLWRLVPIKTRVTVLVEFDFDGNDWVQAGQNLTGVVVVWLFSVPVRRRKHCGLWSAFER